MRTIKTLILALAVIIAMPAAAQQSEKEVKKAVKALEKTAKSSDAKGQYDIALRFLNGDNIKQDTELARKWLNSAAKNGDAEMKYTVAQQFFKLSSDPKDYKTATGWLESAAKTGDGKMQIRVGDDYLNANGVQKNLKKAEGWYKKATKTTELGYVSLGDLYYKHLYKKKKGLKFYGKGGSEGISRINEIITADRQREMEIQRHRREQFEKESKEKLASIIPKMPKQNSKAYFDNLYNKAMRGDHEAALTYYSYNRFDKYEASNFEVLVKHFNCCKWAEFSAATIIGYRNLNGTEKKNDIYDYDSDRNRMEKCIQLFKSRGSKFNTYNPQERVLGDAAKRRNSLPEMIYYLNASDCFYENRRGMLIIRDRNDIPGYKEMKDNVIERLSNLEPTPDLIYWLCKDLYYKEVAKKLVVKLDDIDKYHFTNIFKLDIKFTIKEDTLLANFLNKGELEPLSEQGFRPATVKLANANSKSLSNNTLKLAKII